MVNRVGFTALLQQRRRPIVILLVLLLLVLVMAAGFFLGQYAAYRGMGAEPKNYKGMQAELVAVQNTLRSRDAELAIQRTRHEVDRQALELVRKEMAGQKVEIAGLVEGLGFYRGLMSPDGIAPGLSLRAVELIAGEQSGQIFYRIVVQQEARKHEQLKGNLKVTLKGQRGAEAIEYSLAELCEDFKAGGSALQFRYFQLIKGALILPEGFKPHTVVVEVRTEKPNEFNVREEYPWKLAERFTHVGQ